MSLSVFCRRCTWSELSTMSGPSRLKPVAISASGSSGPQLVAGELLADEAVVRLVGVEGADDVVAVAPRVRPHLVVLEAVASRRSAPGRASAGPSVRRSAARPAGGRSASRRRRGDASFTKASISCGRRRQADEVERHAADEHLLLAGGESCSPAASSFAMMK